MIVGPTRHANPQLLGDALVACGRRRVVIAVPHFDGRQASGHKTGNRVVQTHEAWMCERRDTPRGPDDRRDLTNRRAAAGHESRASFAQEHIERFATIRHVTGRDERIGQLRAANRPARSARGVGDERTNLDRIPEIFQTSRHHVQATQTVGALRAQEIDERSKLRIDEVAQDVDVARRFDSGDFDSRNKTKTVPVGSGLRFRNAGGGVVIRDADDGQTEARSAGDERGRRQPAIRGSRV